MSNHFLCLYIDQFHFKMKKIIIIFSKFFSKFFPKFFPIKKSKK